MARTLLSVFTISVVISLVNSVPVDRAPRKIDSCSSYEDIHNLKTALAFAEAATVSNCLHEYVTYHAMLRITMNKSCMRWSCLCLHRW